MAPVTAYPPERRSTYSSVGTVIETSTGVVAHSVRWARTPMARAKGLLARPPLGDGDALVLVGARQVHTFGLRYRIDVAFCDSASKIIHVEHDLGPRRVTRWVRGARVAIEARAGTFHDLCIGKELVVRIS